MKDDRRGAMSEELKSLRGLIDAYGRACRRDGNPAWESDEGKALAAELEQIEARAGEASTHEPYGWIGFDEESGLAAAFFMGPVRPESWTHYFPLYTHPPTGDAAGKDQWIRVDDRLPEPGKTVLATYKNRLGKLRRIRAQYIAPKTREQNVEHDELEGEYDEATDTYYWTAGWYECIDNWSDYSHVAVCEASLTKPAEGEKDAKA
jgi:hypothetical protein